MQTNDIAKFGKFEWVVLEVKSNKLLLLTKNIIELQTYHDKSLDVTWTQTKPPMFMVMGI